MDEETTNRSTVLIKLFNRVIRAVVGGVAYCHSRVLCTFDDVDV